MDRQVILFITIKQQFQKSPLSSGFWGLPYSVLLLWVQVCISSNFNTNPVEKIEMKGNFFLLSFSLYFLTYSLKCPYFIVRVVLSGETYFRNNYLHIEVKQSAVKLKCHWWSKLIITNNKYCFYFLILSEWNKLISSLSSNYAISLVAEFLYTVRRNTF